MALVVSRSDGKGNRGVLFHGAGREEGLGDQGKHFIAGLDWLFWDWHIAVRAPVSHLEICALNLEERAAGDGGATLLPSGEEFKVKTFYWSDSLSRWAWTWSSARSVSWGNAFPAPTASCLVRRSMRQRWRLHGVHWHSEMFHPLRTKCCSSPFNAACVGSQLLPFLYYKDAINIQCHCRS